ncbi:ABC transporter-like,P-loop containing nucleoside triphosphate hydrolase,AAA+ ATPase domain,ABC [Cinara cedri]|uniref:ABC transporter-like,P-loop containing nucleoside triphosphate hydrolase,AAA+ ATPase domain,ABC n=1 Tax=Cinara cedri TaxID=506608 RepID=A0A5E4MQZ4_9HEMI|nr:ABC transporter-like,P-loop containing nucleoside triphosphate hydrolase,AAA+ ATPase domain,ABC [Cinara cedri]
MVVPTTRTDVTKFGSAMGRTASTVSFAVPEVTAGGVDGELPEGEEEEILLVDPSRTRLFSVSKDRPIARIPTRADMKTLTHMARRPAVDIEFHDLTYAVNTTAGQRTILKGINGFFRSGHLTAIMGPSGAGKSSLMNILAGYVRSDIKGQIQTNGYPRNMQLFKKLSSYIMQEDLLQPRLTVVESLRYAARLKIGRELSNEDQYKAVDEVLDLLGVSVCRNTYVEKLSGGQRKRLSVALELVNNPPVIFLDEPTTGLDIVAIKQCVALLVDLAKQGRTVVCTIHQPSSSLFHMFDQVYMLAKGSCIYNGTPRQLVPFLAQVGHVCKPTHNPADYIFEVLDNGVDTILELTREIQNGKIILCDDINVMENDKPNTKRLSRNEALEFEKLSKLDKTHSEYSSSFNTQFSILLSRKMKQTFRNTIGLWISFFHHVFSAFLLGSIYYGIGLDGSRPFENFKFCISVIVFFVYTHVMGPVLTLPSEVKLLRREYFNHWYSLRSYVLASAIHTIPSMLLFGSLFLVIVYFMSAQPIEWIRFGQFMAIGLFTGYISEGLGVLIGSSVKNSTGAVLTPAVLAPLLALAVYGMGYGLAIEPLMESLMAISFLRYSLVGISTSLYGNGRANMDCSTEDLYCHYRSPELLLRDLGMSGQSIGYQFVGLAVFGLLFRVSAYYVIRLRMMNKPLRKIPLYFKKFLRW